MNSPLRDLHFTKIAEAKPDSKKRVTLGNVPIKAHHYRVYMNDVGQILLDPQLRIPASEMWLFKNKKALRSVLRGIEGAKRGELLPAPEDYSKYLKE